jgi:hypothetical protein
MQQATLEEVKVCGCCLCPPAFTVATIVENAATTAVVIVIITTVSVTVKIIAIAVATAAAFSPTAAFS